MTEEIVMPVSNLYTADGLTLEQAAMVEFLAIGAHAIRRTEIKPGWRVLVVGAGPIGLGHGSVREDRRRVRVGRRCRSRQGRGDARHGLRHVQRE
jgi:threonine dehydrogenase-like Zn-dependent dehydrogenase